MGWDVVEIGLKHNLPVDDPLATAREIAKRLDRNIRLVALNEYEYDVTSNTVSRADGDDFIELGEFKVNDSTTFTKMTVSNYQAKRIFMQIGIEKLFTANFKDDWARLIIDDIEESFEVYELDDDELYIRIFQENVDLDVYIMERWRMWESAFHSKSRYQDWLLRYREKIYERAKIFGCSEVIICSDQGPTQLIYDRMNWLADNLKEYAKSFSYLKDQDYYNVKDWERNAKKIRFADYFADKLEFVQDEFVDVIFDDFKDMQ